MPQPLGSLFPEGIISEKKRRFRIASEKSNLEVNRIWIFVLLTVFGLGILLARLFTLTIIEGWRFRKLAQENRVRETKIPAPRGIIYDREGIALVRNIPAFILPNGAVYFEQRPATFSGEISESVAREYIYGSLFAHVIGYTGEISKEELESQKSPAPVGAGQAPVKSQKFDEDKIEYTLGDIVGKTGIEKSNDILLRGQDGKQLLEVDALGNRVRVLGRIEPIVGKNINLSVDLTLQKMAAEQLAEKKGAIIVVDPNTGGILALYSSPSFDPNKFVQGEEVEEILADPNNSLFNRAISGTYPPGSTFKIITATAALESGAITSKTKIEDVGILTVGRFSFANWYFTSYGKKEGLLDIVGAIRRSNDIFFYKTGEMVGIEKLASWARKMGVETILGIDIAGEETGVMPDPEWQKKVRGENWYLGNTYHVAIGQGDLLTTPLQVNAWTNIIANGGKLCRPKLVKSPKFALSKIEGSKVNPFDKLRVDAERSRSIKSQNEQCKDLGIKKETISLIKEGMKQACNQGGTGWPLFKFKIANSKLQIDSVDFLETYESTTSGKPLVEIPTACKTGTSEFGDPKNRTHAWFTVFAPVVNPQISVTVLVEGGGEGSSVAGPMAKRILEEWFGR